MRLKDYWTHTLQIFCHNVFPNIMISLIFIMMDWCFIMVDFVCSTIIGPGPRSCCCCSPTSYPLLYILTMRHQQKQPCYIEGAAAQLTSSQHSTTSPIPNQSSIYNHNHQTSYPIMKYLHSPVLGPNLRESMFEEILMEIGD